MHLRLIGLEAAQGPARGRRLGDAVAAAHALELALADNLHRHAHLAVVGPLRRAGEGGGHDTQRRKVSKRQYPFRRYLNTVPSSCMTLKVYINPKTLK